VSSSGFDPAAITLIAITDDLRDGADGLVARAAAVVRGGATMVQVRLKNADARTLVEVTRRLVDAVPVPVVVNDRPDVALAAGAAGVHLGFDDLPVAAARRLVPPGFVVGASLGEEAEAPNARDADYVGIGPVFDTPTKPDAGAPIGTAGFSRLLALGGRPAAAIGGVDATNAAAVVHAGAQGIAVIRAVFGARDPEAAARTVRAAVEAARAASPAGDGAP
jgi:thiamine-phosphate pyrophosphorylase